MAGDYRIATQYPTVEFLGGTQTRQVMAVGVFTVPSNIYFEFRIPRADYKADIVAQEAEGYSASLEADMQDPNIADITWFQSQQADGYLVDMATVYVVSDSGNSTANVDVPFGHTDPRYLIPHIQPTVDELNKAEAL